jgi:hypothetical protein
MLTVTLNLWTLFKVIGLIAGAAAVIGIFALLISSVRRWFASRAFADLDRQGFRRRWAEIEQMAGASGEVQRKLAVMEADKLLDHALKALAMPGDTLGERLKFAQYKYPKLREVWWAHKVRNQLVHEASYRLDAGVARNAVRAFKSALSMLGAI